MRHIHLAECSSTQKYLKMNFKNSLDRQILVSTGRQTSGVGRTGNKWQEFRNGLSFSFTLNPCEPLTLTSLEIGVLLVDFFSKKFFTKLLLKWPNDLLTPGMKKCGGIISEIYSNEVIMAGVGINLGKIDERIDDFISKMSVDCVNEEITSLSHTDKESIPAEIFDFIKKNRLSAEEVQSKWTNYCAHLGKEVIMKSGNITCRGTFVGIGDGGEALVQNRDNGMVDTIVSGSLDVTFD